MRPDKSNQVRRIAAAGVEDHRSRHEVLGSESVQRVGSARLEASIQLVVHVPCFLAVNARHLLEVSRHRWQA
jgi:hypothetical protein